MHAEHGADGVALGAASSTCHSRWTPSASGAETICDQARVEPRKVGGGAATRRSPDDFAEGGVQARADAHAEHPVTRHRALSTSCARVKGTDAGPMLPKNGNDSGTFFWSMPSRSHSALVCTRETWWMMKRSASDQSKSRGLPRGLGQVEPGVHQAAGVGVHLLDVADAQVVVLGAGPGDAADDAVALGVQVAPAQHHGGGPGAER